MNNKLVSVCINAYNAEKYIQKTINSVINQSYKNLQIIVVDDCSTDNTYDLVKSINDDRIEVHKTTINGHMSFACNEALKYIKGDYVAHLDADDLWTVDKIEKQVEFLEQNPEYGACFTQAEIIDEENNICDNNFDDLRKLFELKNRPHSELYRFFYDNSNKLCHSSAVIRTGLIKSIGNYDVSILFLQDFDLWMRALTLCHIYIYPERLTLYRNGGNSSEMTLKKWNAYHNESVRIIYKSINLCPDDLFLEAFADKLRLSGAHTHDEVELEKAFLLLEGPFAYKSNPILGIYKFEKLFKQEKFVKLAAEKFNFTTRDLYNIQQTRCFLDINEHNHLVGSLDNLNRELEITQNHMSDLKKHNQDLETHCNNLETHCNNLETHCNNLEDHCKGLEKYNQDLKNHCKDLEKYNQDLEKNNQNQNDYIKSLEVLLHSTEDQLNDLGIAYSKLRNNLFVRILLFIKRLFTKNN